MGTKVEIFSQLLRELEIDIGTRDLSDLVFEALVESIKSLDVTSVDEFRKEFCKLLHLIENTEPKFGILDYHFNALNWDFEQIIYSRDMSVSQWKKLAIKKVKSVLKSGRKHKKKIIKER